MEEWSRARKDAWVVRTRYGWYPFLVAAPPLLALVAALGYYYTAMALGWRLLLTLWLVLTLLFLDGLMLRWLFVARRHLATEEYRKRREAAAQEAAEQAERDKPADDMGPERRSEPQIDIPRMSTQARQLIQVLNVVVLVLGLWIVWADFFPALGFSAAKRFGPAKPDRRLSPTSCWPSLCS